MKKFLLFLGVTGAALSVGTSVQAADAPAYGDLYNVEWCPCNPEEPFDADGSVVMGKTVMCPCNGLYSGYKKGFDEDIRDIKRAAKTQLNKLNYFKYYIGMDYNIASPSAASDHLSIDDIRFANGPIKLKTDNLIDDQDNLSFVLGARVSKYWGLEAFYEKTYEDKTLTSIDNHTLNTGSSTGEYLMNEFTTKYSAYGLDLVGYIPVSAYFDFVGSVGVAKYDFETSANFAVYDVTGIRLKEVVSKKFDDSNVGWRAAIGAQVNIAEGVALRGMYRYVSIGGDIVDDMSEVSLGVRFLF
ncbi:unknown [Proteobacteria bacterium CAG:495]|nr:unknown [Proteobacteria bacterium CAG:495]